MTTQQHTNYLNGLDLDVLKETVGAIEADGELGKCRFRASNKWIGAGYNCTTVSDFYGAGREMSHAYEFEMHADEPPVLAGADQAANPVEHLLHALAGCVTTSMVAHAAVHGIEIEELESQLEGDIDLRGFLGLDSDIPKGYTNIRVKFKVKTDPANLPRLRNFAEMSPVYHTLTDGAKVDIDIQQV
ncbi:MAG: OsmC family protein [Phycisphaerae bacterium]|jgi:uncharacterized OsmC-like protein|nr:OsmC family protein [Phycisphaerae bacterium]